ncbi:dermonecrotic toxin domain-containing protein [Pseudomonas sp. ANT_H12B]|uniref:dermonecrotic toxin domain-containing protein n=1 Tax=Pseudomonas sp. ANT_H12B TaxID=2597348 RepID=UPI0011EF332C|nr:DUF6543 domain-containing protein [Pseudomonas sp. ANT_H12B]KAA0961746.1 hypothetical protein FQ185_25195 [Pseudomonas sp. ANT_H12B]
MSKSPVPLFFPEVLQFPGLWNDLGKTHGLTQRDFEWFSHLELASQTLRGQQSPPMLAEKILVSADNLEPIPLAGSFVLSAPPDDHGEILYTPYGGIKKFDSRSALSEQLKRQLNSATEDDDLLAFMALAQRKTLVAATSVQVAFEVIEGDVFEDQSAVITHNQHINNQAMLDELLKLPTLTSLLNKALGEALSPVFAGLDQSQTQANVFSGQRWANSISLSDAVLLHYRHRRWPIGQRLEFSNPKKNPVDTDQQDWENAVIAVSGKLASLLSAQLQSYWNTASTDGASRRDFFSRAIRELARADLLLKREADIISAQQSQALHQLIEPPVSGVRPVTVETVRLWEHEANYVELAGSLMINHANAFLYTPTLGLQVLKDYPDLKQTLLSKFSAASHEDELYGLLSLEERNRFIGFDQPHVTGVVISGSIFKTLFESIIFKQLQNMDHALQVFCHSDGAVDIHALFDKALDIRTMISEPLLSLDAHGRWSTRPVLTGKQKPSIVRADTAAAFVKTFGDVESLISADFAAQPVASLALQRVYLEKMKPQLAHALSVGIRGEASLRVLDATLRNAEQAIIDTVFNPDKADRKSRLALNGFRPDAYSLILECSGQRDVLPLANCVLLTERGGIDTRNSGRAILWTPAAGLEVFDSVNTAKLEVNRRLLDPRKRLALLENLTPAQRKFHQRYSLNSLRLIEGNVLQYLSQSSIEHFLAACERVRSLDLTDAKKYKALNELTKTAIDTNLRRATLISKAIMQQQTLPAWLGMAPVEDQQLHIELLEQYRNVVTDDKDYLHGIQTLSSYVHDRLASLLGSRFPEARLDPDHIEIIPNLALAGPSRTLTEFALNHINIAQGTGFKIASSTTQTLPDRLDQQAVQQLLQSLNIQRDYAKLVTDTLTGGEASIRKLRFVQQLPWQLLQHAHALKLQQRLSASAFDLIWQLLDMPDAIARAAVQGAHAILRPLELIKTAGAAAVKALGLYLIGPGTGHEGPQILYAPYHAGSVFTEFENEASVVTAMNTPGALQDLIIRRLPGNQQASFSNLFKITLGQESEITLASSSIGGNLLAQLFRDNTRLLTQMLGSQAQITGLPDWEAAKNLFSSGIKLISGLLPGKLAYVRFLWQSYLDFKDSAEALQDHHWTRALQAFIAGAAQMVTMGQLSLEASVGTAQATAETAPVASPIVEPKWSDVKPTAPSRTLLQPFEAPTVELKDLAKDPVDGIYVDSVSKKQYAPVAGKVYPVAKPGAVWQILNEKENGPSLLKTPTRQMVLDPDVHTVHYGKALSKMHNQYVSNLSVRGILNIEARGMEDIRIKHPEKARIIHQAIDLARYYAFNSLHNMAQLRHLVSGTRLDTFLKAFFDASIIDTSILDKIKNVIVPICKALVDPNEDFMSTERFVVGSNKHGCEDAIAFVVRGDLKKNVHFTEKFFDQQLDLYKFCLKEPFDIDSHAQAATLIHEFSHLYSETVDIATLESRRPFSDLVTSIPVWGTTLKQVQLDFQRQALSLATPREQLFTRWNSELDSWDDLDDFGGLDHVGKEILKVTGCATLDEARNAFLNPQNVNLRIDTILRNADSIAFLICEMGRQLDPVPGASTSQP